MVVFQIKVRSVDDILVWRQLIHHLYHLQNLLIMNLLLCSTGLLAFSFGKWYGKVASD